MTPEQFRSAREKLKLTQQELADKLEVHRVTVVDWERGKKPILKITQLALEHLSCGARLRSGPTMRR
jgi:DNA-binding XRE family transcriptional regulator